MGFSIGDLGYAVPGYGEYKLVKGAGDEKRKGYQGAADQYGEASNTDWQRSQQGLDRQLGAYGQAQNVYNSQQGYFNSPGYLEQLYKQRQGGNDPTFNYYSQQAQGQNARHMNAMGLGNSTYSAQAGNDMQAHLIADQQSQMASLAGGASGEQRSRMSDQFGAQMGISSGESGAIGQAYGQGIQTTADFQKNQIAAQLAKAGVSQEQINQFMQAGIGAAKVATSGGGA